MSKSKPNTLRVHSGGKLIPKDQCAQITVKARVNGFLTGFSMPDALDWIVNDIKIDGRSLFETSGNLPGDLFIESPPSLDSYVEWDALPRGHDVVVLVTYNGAKKDGEAFDGRLIFSEITSDEVGAYIALKDAVVAERRRLARIVAARTPSDVEAS